MYTSYAHVSYKLRPCLQGHKGYYLARSVTQLLLAGFNHMHFFSCNIT